jgi:hypothetical protein
MQTALKVLGAAYAARVAIDLTTRCPVINKTKEEAKVATETLKKEHPGCDVFFHGSHDKDFKLNPNKTIYVANKIYIALGFATRRNPTLALVAAKQSDLVPTRDNGIAFYIPPGNKIVGSKTIAMTYPYHTYGGDFLRKLGAKAALDQTGGLI